jgi:hypothetical protein
MERLELAFIIFLFYHLSFSLSVLFGNSLFNISFFYTDHMNVTAFFKEEIADLER